MMALRNSILASPPAPASTGQDGVSSPPLLSGRSNSKKAAAGPNQTGADALAGRSAPVKFSMPIPPSTNALFRNVRGRGRVKTEAYYDFITLGITAIKLQRVPHITGRVVLVIGVERARATADISNRLKALEDVIVKAGVIEDDRLVTAIAICWTPPANGLAWVQIHPADRLDLQFHPSTDAATGGWIVAASQEDKTQWQSA
jgi:Holliday junction resolvase RusA-like endonuclease